jgi:glycosyltransferase involved in cell wall biosynthesis
MGHFAELLGGVTTLVDRAPSPRAFLGAHTLVVVRPDLDETAREILRRVRRRGLRLIADYDDLLFAGDPSEHPLVMNGTITASACAARIARQRASLAHFDGFTVATEPLADELGALVGGAPVTCVPNGLSPSWIRQGRMLHRPWRPGDARVIRYLSGSPSHDADFAAIASPLASFLREHPDVRLEVVGPVGIAAGTLPADRLRCRPRVPHVDLPRLLATSWATLAPLMPTRFNACRSAIKLLESAAFEAPCIASPTADMLRHRESGVLLAREEADWHHALSTIVDDDRRLTLGRQGRAFIDRHGRASEGAGLITKLIESVHD